MGEYARSLAIACAAARRWQDADIRFIVSRQAPYAGSVPFPATLLSSSPTFHSTAVIEVIEALRPHVVVFDNAGRTAQLLAASRFGARVVYISARPRQRRKAFRWRWMRLIDEHWIPYPEFIAGRLNTVERIKLNLLHRPTLRYLDVILSRAAETPRESLSASVGGAAGTYVLLVPGGGTGHPRARDANAVFLSAARVLADEAVDTVFVGPHDPPPQGSPLRCFESLPQPDLIDLMAGAKLIVANGGSTLLQGIACGRACVAVPIAKDQKERIKRCVAAAVAVPAALDAASIVRETGNLLRDDAGRAALARRAVDLKLADGVEIALAALSRLIESK
jgi:hypothetical protein